MLKLFRPSVGIIVSRVASCVVVCFMMLNVRIYYTTREIRNDVDFTSLSHLQGKDEPFPLYELPL